MATYNSSTFNEFVTSSNQGALILPLSFPPAAPKCSSFLFVLFIYLFVGWLMCLLWCLIVCLLVCWSVCLVGWCLLVVCWGVCLFVCWYVCFFVLYIFFFSRITFLTILRHTSSIIFSPRYYSNSAYFRRYYIKTLHLGDTPITLYTL